MTDQNQRTRVGAHVTIAPRGKKRVYTADFRCDGRHCRRSLGTANKRLALQRAKRLDDDLESGVFGTQEEDRASNRSKSVSIADAIDEFLDCKNVDGLGRKTLTKYRGILNTFREFAESKGINAIEQVTVSLFDSFRSYRRPHLSDKSMHHEATLVKSFVAWCDERGYVASNFLRNRRFQRPKPKRIANVLTLEQVNVLVASAPRRLRVPLAVIAFTGMRSGECQRLRVEDIDFEAGWIHIVSRDGHETKTRDSWRVPMHPALRTVLAEYRAPAKGYFFTAEASKKYPNGDNWINTKRLNESFQHLLQSQDLPAGRKSGGFSLHDLRHAFKSICIAHGVPREYVDRWQGHASVNAASDLYVHTFDEESQRHIADVPFLYEPC